MIKRHTTKDVTDDSMMDSAKRVIYVLVVAAVILWVGPLVIGDDLPDADSGDDCANPDSSLGMANCIEETANNIGFMISQVINIAKYMILVGAIASIAILYIRPV